MKNLFIVWFLLFCFVSFSQENKVNTRLKKGHWRATLTLSSTHQLPFELEINKKGGGQEFTVVNGDEKINLIPGWKSDTLTLSFPYFNSVLVVTKLGKKHISGHWQNYQKGQNYSIPFEASLSNESRFDTNDAAYGSFGGKWEVQFDPGKDSYPAVGVFQQSNKELNGTFLTETGDYRFLSGNVRGDSLFLSCFDGSHAFLFQAQLVGDSIHGDFLSGKHWKTTWHGKKNEHAKLIDPENLTFKVKPDAFTFELPRADSSLFTYPNPEYAGKVVIVQLMGSWCPNCLDETIYFKELYEQFHASGLEIIAVAYETGNSFPEFVQNMERLQKRLDLPFQFLVGGAAKKNLASAQFAMLNEITSFPTTIFIDKKGEVRRIHTGFNGPGTGQLYRDYVGQTNAFIAALLQE